MSKVLWENKWVQVKETDEGYTYTHYKWCQGTGVAVLPFAVVPSTVGETKIYLARVEKNPAHGNEFTVGAVTGGADVEGEALWALAVRELEEEAGLIADANDLIYLGHIYDTKGSDTVTHYYAVDVYKCKQGEMTGDGSVFEQGAYTQWVTEDEAAFATDRNLATMITRLKLRPNGL